MPMRVNCKGCGYVLYENEKILLPVVEVAKKYSYLCPSCGRRLNTSEIGKSIEVYGIEKSNRTEPPVKSPKTVKDPKHRLPKDYGIDEKVIFETMKKLPQKEEKG